MSDVPTPEYLIQQNQGLVHDLARKISRKLPRSVDLDDLVGYGQLGLAEAARDFDPHRGVRFSTYAYYRIRGAIYDGVSRMNWGTQAHSVRYQAASNDVLQTSSNDTLAEPGTLNENSAWLAGTTRRLAIVYLCSLSGTSSEDRGFDPVDPHSVNAANSASNMEVIGVMRELIDELSDQSATLIRDVYFSGMTLQDAGRKQGIGKSWASRLHARALDHLARGLRRHGVDAA